MPILALGLFLALPASGDDKSIALGLHYTVEPGCPDSERVWAKLAIRTTSVVRARADEARLVLVLVVTPSQSGGFAGELILRDGGETLVKRVLGDTTCDSLIDAMTLVSAMELESIVASRGQASTRLSERQTRIETVTISPNAVATPNRPASTQMPKKAPYSLGAAVGLCTAPLAEPLETFGAYFGLSSQGAPSVRRASVSLQYGAQLRRFDAGDARFTWVSARSTLCPIGISASWITVDGCGLLELGALIGKGQRTLQPATTLGAWLAPGIASQIAVHSRFTVAGILLGAVAPILRDEFFFAPSIVANRVRAIGLVAEGRVGVTF